MSPNYTSSQLADLLGVHVNCISRNALDGIIPSFKENGDYRFTDETVGEIIRLGWLRYTRKRKKEMGKPLRRTKEQMMKTQ